MALYLGIDLGTSGCRAAVIDSQYQLQAFAKQAWSDELLTTPVNRPQLWWQGVCELLDQLLPRVERYQIRAIAVDATSSTLLLCSPNGEPLTPALLYNDSSSQAEADLISQHVPADSAAHGASSSLAKLLQLRQRVQPPFVVSHQADWINGKLSGQFGTSDENNALKLGYDPVARNWPEWLEELEITRSQLPKVIPPGSSIAPLATVMAERFGLSPQTEVIAGTTDSIAAFIASGACQIGDAVTSLGSTTVLKLLSAQPIFSPHHGVYSHRLGRQWLVGGASNSGAAVLAQHFNPEQLAQLSKLIDPNQPSNLDYYPLPASGERFPIYDPQMQPRLTPKPAQDHRFLQAMLEGLSRIEQQGYQLLHELGAPYPQRIFTAGGGSHNSTWNSIRQKRLGSPLYPAQQSEAAWGSAAIAAGLLG